jgi:diguanylate cyclase (GGDEF)-like protein
MMDNNHPLVIALRNLTHDLRLFIELSLQETDAAWEEWLRLMLKEDEVKCWEKKNCSKDDCPAYLNTMDVDNFKQINDDYGHLIGDWILRECASILGKSIRSSDLLVRFGGDEFLVATRETDSEECDALGARVKKNLLGWNKKHTTPDYGLSVSIECAMFEQGKDLMEVIKEADSRMYENKLK